MLRMLQVEIVGIMNGEFCNIELPGAKVCYRIPFYDFMVDFVMLTDLDDYWMVCRPSNLLSSNHWKSASKSLTNYEPDIPMEEFKIYCQKTITENRESIHA